MERQLDPFCLRKVWWTQIYNVVGHPQNKYTSLKNEPFLSIPKSMFFFLCFLRFYQKESIICSVPFCIVRFDPLRNWHFFTYQLTTVSNDPCRWRFVEVLNEAIFGFGTGVVKKHWWRDTENPEVRLFVEGQLHFLTGNTLQPFDRKYPAFADFQQGSFPQKYPIQNSGNSHTEKLRRNLWEIVVQIAACWLAFFCNYLEINFRQRIPWKLTWPAGNSPYFIRHTKYIFNPWYFLFHCVMCSSDLNPAPEVELLKPGYTKLCQQDAAGGAIFGKWRNGEAPIGLWEFPVFF